MTLEQIKDAINSVSLSHKSIKEFYVGNRFDVGTYPSAKYPVAFLEIPYNIAYSDDRKFKTYNFAFLVLLRKDVEDIVDSHKAISKAENIGDAILSKLQNDYAQQFRINGINALSLDNFSDDDVAGVRYQLTITVIRNYSLPKCYSDQFEEPC